MSEKMTKRVKDLKLFEAVQYRGKKYKVDNIEIEGNLRTIRLTSLTYPREISCVCWNGESEVVYSPLKTTRHFVMEHLENTKYKISDCEISEWDLGMQSLLCMRCIADQRKACVAIHSCFDETFLGIVYCIDE